MQPLGPLSVPWNGNRKYLLFHYGLNCVPIKIFSETSNTLCGSPDPCLFIVITETMEIKQGY